MRKRVTSQSVCVLCSSKNFRTLQRKYRPVFVEVFVRLLVEREQFRLSVCFLRKNLEKISSFNELF